MRKLELLKMEIARTKLAKDALELRGKEFAQAFGRFSELWTGYFEKQAADYLDFVARNPNVFPAEDIKKLSNEEEAAFRQSVINELIVAYSLGRESQFADIVAELSVDVSFELDNAGAQSYASERAGSLISGVNETTKKEIGDLILKASQEKWSLGKVSEEIRSRFEEFGKYRANLISVMEMGNAYEAGKRSQFDSYAAEMGTVGWKRSQTQGDDKVRPSHWANQEAGWIPANELFPGTQTDHAPHGFNCRCVTSYRLTDPNSDN